MESINALDDTQGQEERNEETNWEQLEEVDNSFTSSYPLTMAGAVRSTPSAECV